MSKKGLKFGIASAAVIGAGAAVLQAKNKSEAKKAAETTTVTSEPKNDYRNTERGKDKKNSKGIYYTNGNYEAFARPEKPEPMITTSYISSNFGFDDDASAVLTRPNPAAGSTAAPRISERRERLFMVSSFF